MDISVRRYGPALALHWAQVLQESKNGLFQFDREFMEYHADRFDDLSLIAYVNGQPVALFPLARNPQSGEVASHPGLTFGGIVLVRDIRSTVSFAVIDALLDEVKGMGIAELVIKLVPQVFSSYPSGELDYALSRRGFSLVRRDLSSVLPLVGALAPNTSKRQAVAKAHKAGVALMRVRPREFHELLSGVLEARHGTKPVHSAEELELLASRFPAQIFILGACLSQKLVAGATVFCYGHVWHTQYLACSDEGRVCGALDSVITAVRDEATKAGCHYLSFGVSTENDGKALNEGLLWQKESFGARSITHDFMAGKL